MCTASCHLLRLLVLWAEDMKAARSRALLAAAVPPVALRLLPTAAMGAGRGTARPRLPRLAPSSLPMVIMRSL